MLARTFSFSGRPSSVCSVLSMTVNINIMESVCYVTPYQKPIDQDNFWGDKER